MLQRLRNKTLFEKHKYVSLNASDIEYVGPLVSKQEVGFGVTKISTH